MVLDSEIPILEAKEEMFQRSLQGDQTPERRAQICRLLKLDPIQAERMAAWQILNQTRR